MKRSLFPLLILQLFLLNCTSTKPVIDNKLALKDYKGPFKIFGIGYGEPGYNILTLTDNNDEYVIIKARQNTALKVGGIYTP